MPTRGITTFVSAWLLLSVFVLSSPGTTQDIESKVDEYINPYLKMGTFSGSVLIARKGIILLSKGYGMANYENDVPNTLQTKFRLGSVTKQFTATSIMQLQEKGLLNVYDPISKYLPDYPNGEEITIHHLLTHTSGIPNFTSFPEYQETMMLLSSVEKTMERFKYRPLEFTPGEKFKYSNSGYILLGYIIEKVSGKPYEDYLKENIFQPLNMMDTGYDYHRPLIKHRASGYVLGTNELVNAIYIDMSTPYAAGGLYSTVEDLYLWDQALYTEKLVGKNSLDKMFTPFRGDYGYGWFIIKAFDRRLITHGGTVNGFYAYISRYVDDKVCIIVLSNIESAPVDKISLDLAAIVFGEKYEVPKIRTSIKVDSKIYNVYVGEYELAPNFIITVTKEDNHLFAQVTGQSKFELYPESEVKFYLKMVNAQITFVKNYKGEVTQLVLHQYGRDHFAKKIK